MHSRPAVLALLLLVLAGCGRTAPSRTSGNAAEPRGPRSTLRGLETRVLGEEDPLLELGAYDDQDLFAYGLTALDGGNPTLARVAFSRLIAEFPRSPNTVPARYNLALAVEAQGRPLEAADLYLEYVAVLGDAEPVEQAELLLHAGLLRWEERELPGATLALSRALQRPELDVADRWEAKAVLARIGGLSGNWVAAEKELESLRRAVRRYTRTTGQIVPWSSAMVWFHAAELYRDQAKAQRLLDVDDLRAARRWLNTTASLFLESRRCHKRVLEHRHPDWSGEAALALGAINEEFREQMLRADTPTGLDAESTAVYLDLLEEQTRAFLEKAAKDYRWLLLDSNDLRVTGEALEALKEALRRVEEQLELPDSTATGPARDAPDGEP